MTSVKKNNKSGFFGDNFEGFRSYMDALFKISTVPIDDAHLFEGETVVFGVVLPQGRPDTRQHIQP